MPVPKFNKFMKPVLYFIKSREEATVADCVNYCIQYFNLSDEDIKLLTSSGSSTQVKNRTVWALTYLKKALCIENIQRGIYKITDRGRDLCSEDLDTIDRSVLARYSEFQDFSNANSNEETSTIRQENYSDDIDNETPEDLISKGIQIINKELENDLLTKIRSMNPYQFEKLVIDIITTLGYGDPNKKNDYLTTKSRDGGVDGIINQDRLGLDKIYLQAKRYNNPVGRPELQNFSGALTGKNATKGVFITTSDFTSDAMEYVKGIQQTIILINGNELVNLMIKENVGVQTKEVFSIKRIDNDYFDDYD